MGDDATGDLYPSLRAQSRPSTILACKVLGEGKDLWEELARTERKVERAVKKIIASLDGSKFTDPDFGPTEDDEYGARAMYRDGKVRMGLRARIVARC